MVLCINFTWQMVKTCVIRLRGIEGQNTAWSNYVLCIPFILSGGLNESLLHTHDACIITIWRLGLRAPLVTRHQKGDFTLAGTTFTFPEISSQRKSRTHTIRRGDGKHFTAKMQVCSLHLLRRKDARKYLNKGIFARDAAVPWCLHGL